MRYLANLQIGVKAQNEKSTKFFGDIKKGIIKQVGQWEFFANRQENAIQIM
jgi:hypothetical protein